MGDLLIYPAFVCVLSSPCTIGKHCCLQYYLVDGKELLKRKVISDRVLLDEYQIQKGLKFTVMEDVYATGAVRYQRIKTGEREIPMVVLDILEQNATNHFIRNLSYEKMLKTSACSICLPGPNIRPIGGIDQILNLICCYSFCHGKDGFNSMKPILRVKYTNEQGNVGNAGVPKVVWYINSYEKKQKILELATSLSQQQVATRQPPPSNVEMMRNDTKKNAEQDDVELIEQNVSEYSPDADNHMKQERRRSFHSTVEGMFCHKCGMEKMEPDQKFCSGCGVAFMYIEGE